LPFVQEVAGTFLAVQRFYPKSDVVVELGGEDAKIIFLTGGTEERMNGTCAGGTGAFIDQMASFLNVSIDELDALSLNAKQVYPIASRCGVFAKSDIQPLLEPRGAQRRYRLFRFTFGRRPNHQRSGPRPRNQRQRPLSSAGRSAF
jgi:activator of 2-hydroxyglutaryl-CoA dehydratase